MKIEWLNAEMTEAIVTRGWFWKRSAHVAIGERWVTNTFGPGFEERCWVFKHTGRYVGWWTDMRLDAAVEDQKVKAERERVADKEWVPVERHARLLRLPRAEVRRG